MDLQYIPRKQLVDKLHEGYRLLPDVEYRENEYAILMYLPEIPCPMTEKQVGKVAAKFARPEPVQPGDRCKHGHFLSGDNVYVRHDGRRVCRACKRRLQAAYQARQVQEYA